MLSTSQLLAAAKQAQGIQSNYRLARILGTTDNTLSRWHSGRVIPDDAYAVRLAQLAGLDPGYVVAAMRAFREKDEHMRSIWMDMAERLAAAPAAPNAGPGGSGHGGTDDGPEFGPSDGSLPHGGLDASADDPSGLCVMSNNNDPEEAARRCRVPSSMSKTHDPCPRHLALAFGIDRPFGAQRPGDRRPVDRPSASQPRRAGIECVAVSPT